MKKIKVAIVHNIIAPYRIPLFEKLATHPDVDLTVFFCSETHKFRKWEIPKDLNFKYEILPGFILEHGTATCSINPIIIQKIKKGGFNAIIIGGYFDLTMQIAFLTAKIKNIPVIMWSEGMKTPNSKIGRIFQLVNKAMVKKCDAIIVPTSMAKKYHTEILHSIEDKIFVAPNIIDYEKVETFKSEIQREQFNLKEHLGLKDKTVLLFVGRVTQLKGAHHLVNVFSKLSKERDDVALVIVGDGVCSNNLQQKCLDHNLETILFVGWKEEKELIRYYLLSDIFILPTLTDLAPLVINEAMSCNLPIIITNVAGNSSDMVKNGINGYIINSGNEKELMQAIKKILENKTVMRKMGEESKNIIDSKFTEENTVNRFINAIKYSIK